MDILEHFESMWSSKIKRKTSTIPKVHYNNELSIGSLNNEDWFYNVPYAFREALDLKFEERKKDKKGYYIWTQGPILSFKNGDTFTATNGNYALQIQFANPMGWDSSKNEMYLGSVVFKKIAVIGNQLTELNQHICSQMEFLKILITGEINC